MLNFSINKDELLHCASMAANVAIKEKYFALLSNILIQARSGVLNFEANTMDISVSCSVIVDNVTDLNICLDAKLFYNIIKKCDSDTFNIQIDRDKNVLIIRNGNSRYNLIYINGADYPARFYPKNDSVFFTLDRKDFSLAIQKVLFCTLNAGRASDGVFIKFGDELIDFVATDGKRMSVFSIKNSTEYTDQIQINKKSCEKILKLIEGEGDIEVCVDLESVEENLKRLFIKFDNTMISLPLSRDNLYIDYKKVLEDQVDKSFPILVDKKSLTSAVQRLLLLCEPSSSEDKIPYSGTITVKENMLELETDNFNTGSAIEKVVANCKEQENIDDNSITIDYGYLASFLSKVKNDLALYISRKKNRELLFLEERNLTERGYCGIIMSINKVA